MFLRYRKATQVAAGRTFAVLMAAALAFGVVTPAVSAEPVEQAAASVEEQGELAQETAGETAETTASGEAEAETAEQPSTESDSSPKASPDAEVVPAPVESAEPALPEVQAEPAAPEEKSPPKSPGKLDSTNKKSQSSGSKQTEPAQVAVQQSSATLTWGVRESFRTYLENSFVAGNYSAKAPATLGSDGLFKFAFDSGETNPANSVLGFDGGANFYGHHGALDITLSDLRLTFTCGTKATLSGKAEGTQLNSSELLSGRYDLATVTFASAVSFDDGTLQSSKVELLETGVKAFSGFYPAGEELDQLKLEVANLQNFVVPASCPVEPSTPTTPTEPSTPVEPSTPTTPTTPTSPTTPSDSKQVGSLVWGFKESFRKYITGPIAQGSVTMSGGASNNGSAYEFAQTKSSVKNGKGSVQFAGGVRFEGHHGELDSKFTSPKVTLTSATAGKISFTATTIHYTDPTHKFSNESIVVATFKDAKKSTNKDGSVTYTAKKVYLTKDGAASFSDFYEAGDLVDSVTFTVGANSSEDGGTSGSDNSSANLAKAKKAGTYKNAKVNKSTLAPGGQFTITAGGFGGNTKGIELAVYSKKTVIKSKIKAGTDGTVSVTATLPKDLSAGTHTLSLEAPNGVIQQVKIKVTASATQTVAQEAAQAEQGPTCVAQAVSGATASWGFKASYVAYVGRLSDGNISTSGVSRSGNSFTWGSGTGKYNTETGMGTIRFGGSVRFTGHSNVMDSTFSGLTVQISGNTGYLYTNVKAKGLENDGLTKNGALLGTISLSGKKSVAGSTLSISGAPVTLTAEGAEAFGGFYNAGDALDPITLKVPLGAETSCDNGTGATLAKFGGKGGLANTGADGMATATAAAIFMMLAGAVSLTVARRQRVRATVRTSR